MKITIPTPCSEKLTLDNFCSKCQHQIKDLSDFGLNDVRTEIEKTNVSCAIFSKSQLDNSYNLKKVINVLAIANLAVLPTYGQEFPRIENHESTQALQFTQTKFNFKLVEIDATKLMKDETFRLLINDQLILDNFEINKDYVIAFDSEINSEILVRIASNKRNVETERLLHNYNFPENIVISRSELSYKTLIMGKINYNPKKEERIKE